MRAVRVVVLLVGVAVLSTMLVVRRGAGDDGERSPSIVVEANQLALDAIRADPASATTIAARQLYLVHAAIYEAWSAFDPEAVGQLDSPVAAAAAAELPEADREAVVIGAADAALRAVFGDGSAASTERFDVWLDELGVAPIAPGLDTPGAVGALLAVDVVQAREGDGSNVALRYAPPGNDPYGPYHADATDTSVQWTPLLVPTGSTTDGTGTPVVDPGEPSSVTVQQFRTPHWGAIAPFALILGNQHRPPAPPVLGSVETYTAADGTTSTSDEAMRAQLGELLALSAGLTEDQKAAAEVWADPAADAFPVGHWNEIAQQVSVRDDHTLADDVGLFFALNGALLDATIVATDAQRVYDAPRPVSLIPFAFAGETVQAWAGPGLGARQLPGEEWRPYQEATVISPPSPGYVAEHSVIAAAAAEVLRQLTGSDDFADGTELPWDRDTDGGRDTVGRYVLAAGTSRIEPGPSVDVVLEWPTFSAAAEQAGMAQRWGGVAIRDADEVGRAMGRSVGADAVVRAANLWLGRVG